MNVYEFQDDFFRAAPQVKEILDALDRLPGAMFMIKNHESRYVYMSHGLREAIYLRPGEEVIGKTDFDLFPAIIAESFRQNDLLVLRDGRTLINEVHVTTFFDGPPIWSFSSKFPLHDGTGKIIGLITINSLYDKMMGENADLNVLLPAINHITKNFDRKLTIAEMADPCGLSESHFMRIFKQRMKITAHDFLERVRMYHAIHAVKHTRESIASIAHRCGFYDHSFFVKRFKKMTGVTPLRYRKEFQDYYTNGSTIALPHLFIEPDAD